MRLIQLIQPRLLQDVMLLNEALQSSLRDDECATSIADSQEDLDDLLSSTVIAPDQSV